MNTKKTLVALALGAAILGAGYHMHSGIKRNLDEVKPVKEQPKYASDVAIPGAPAPDFSATSIDGESIKLSNLEGKLVLLDFWAPWCGPCRDLSQHINELSEKQRNSGLEVIYIAAPSSRKEDIINLREKYNLHYPIIHDEDKTIAKKYGISAIPALVLIKDGKINSSRLGYDCFEWIQKLKIDLKSK